MRSLNAYSRQNTKVRSCHLIDLGFHERLQTDVQRVGVVMGGGGVGGSTQGRIGQLRVFKRDLAHQDK